MYLGMLWTKPLDPKTSISSTWVAKAWTTPRLLRSSELLPTAPVLPEMIAGAKPRSNSEVGSLVATELKPILDLKSGGPWYMEELDSRGIRKRAMSSVLPVAKGPELLGHHISLGARRVSRGSRLRRKMGQEREVVPALFLHGLREIGFAAHLTAASIIGDMCLSWLDVTLGPGFTRGLCDVPGRLNPLSLVFQPMPLRC